MSNKLKIPIMILHGWGLRGSVYNNLVDVLKKQGYTVYAPDLPGFGDEPLLSESMNLKDYVDFVKKFLEKQRIKKVTVIGHSFGGRVAVKMAVTVPEMVEKIVLTGVPIIRHITFKKRIAGFVAVFGKLLPGILGNVFRKILYKIIGEYDYLKAGNMKKTLTAIVNEDLTSYTRKITVPTLLVWGADDIFTPADDVLEIKKLIPHAESVVLQGATHKVPYDSAEKFYSKIKSFL